MISFPQIKFKEIMVFPKKIISRMTFGKFKPLKTDTLEIVSAAFHYKKAMRALKLHNFSGSYLETAKPSVQIVDTKLTQISKIQKDGTKVSVDAFMAGVERTYKSNEKKAGLFVFSKDGKILGHIEVLNKEEYLNGKFKKNGIDKYLRLQYLNTTYGKEYKGIGAVLIDEAKLKSSEYGLGGNVAVYASNYLPNQKHVSPIPFYAKQGFIDIENPQLSKEELIKNFASSRKQFYMFFLNKN